ncbi:MAG TPA: porin family protein [Cyclobacteriaceae bacterium]|nr:porin family protein [Cyclobacteriaceae bacterium]
MKSKIILVVLILSGISFKGLSQAQFALGLKGGVNLSKFDIKEGASNIDNRTGFNAGAFALVKITSFGIQPEVLFSRQGSKFTFNATNYEANFDYITVPIMFKLYVPLGLNLQLGPQLSFLSVADLKRTATNAADDPKTLKKQDYAIAVGAGWDLPFGLTIDARYNFGLSDIKVQPTNSNQPIALKNKVLQISVGYKLIKLGK